MNLLDKSCCVVRLLLAVLLGVALTFPAKTLAAIQPVNCEALAEQEARQAGLPTGLLASISRIEAGRRVGKGPVRAWPWTLNQAGKGMYFETREKALAYLNAAVAGGVRNIDVGCMQINYGWHGKNFGSLEDMMDPHKNVKYAVRFMLELYQLHGNWQAATRHYHSADPTRGEAYYQKVARVRARMTPDPLPGSDIILTDATTAIAPDSEAVANLQPANVNLITRHAAAPLVMLPDYAIGDASIAALLALVPDTREPVFGVPVTKVVDRNIAPAVLRKKWDRIEAFRLALASQ